MNTETLIVNSLVTNPEFLRKTLPFLEERYFGPGYSAIVKIIKTFSDKYHAGPTKEALIIEIEESSLNEDEHAAARAVIDDIKHVSPDSAPSFSWLVDTAEAWCQDRAIYLAVSDAIAIIQGEDEKRDKGAIPDILQDALAVSFDTSIGHDYLEDAEARFDARANGATKIPFDLEWFNKATNGGVERKTLNILMAGTNVGKSLGLVHLASSYIQSGYNVLYITLEMADSKIADRVDANILDITLEDLRLMPKPLFLKAIAGIKMKKTGRLMVKEYPTAGAHVGHFLSHIKELKIKEGFVPDILIIDYLNIAASSRMKPGGPGGSYAYIKSIAEEFRGLAVSTNTAMWSATQVNRSGFDNTDVDLTDTSESFGLPMTVDFMAALMTDDQMEKMNAFMVGILKSRFSDKGKLRKFMVGVDKAKQKLYDMQQPAENYGQNTPAKNEAVDPASKKEKYASFNV